MAHTRKKGGVRKDKKNARMHDAVLRRHANALPKRRSTDQKDIIPYKSGGPDDDNRQLY